MISIRVSGDTTLIRVLFGAMHGVVVAGGGETAAAAAAGEVIIGLWGSNGMIVFCGITA